MTSQLSTDSTMTEIERAAGPRPHILVGVDGAIGGWMALAWAREHAVATGGRLTICHAGPPPGGSTMDALALADPPLSRAVRDTRQRIGGERVDLWLADGDPAGLIAEAADTTAVDLIVVGPSFHGGARSTALRTAATSSRPVVIVRPGQDDPQLPFAGHVVAALDGGPCDGSVAEFAMRYAAAHRLPLAAVHISEQNPGDYWFDEETLETHFAAEPPQIGMLARVVEPLRPRYPHVAVRLCVLAGSAAGRLPVAVAAALLVVVGRRSHRRLVPALGLTSGVMVRNGVPPVVVVPPA